MARRYLFLVLPLIISSTYLFVFSFKGSTADFLDSARQARVVPPHDFKTQNKILSSSSTAGNFLLLFLDSSSAKPVCPLFLPSCGCPLVLLLSLAPSLLNSPHRPGSRLCPPSSQELAFISKIFISPVYSTLLFQVITVLPLCSSVPVHPPVSRSPGQRCTFK